MKIMSNKKYTQFNPDVQIKTEKGKKQYYDKVNRLDLKNYGIEVCMDYVELANMKYKIAN